MDVESAELRESVEEVRGRAVDGRTLGFLAILGAVALWGPSYVATKIVLAEMGPYLLAFVRFALATAFLGPVAVWSLKGQGGVRLPVRRLAVMGLTGGTLYFACQNAGLQYVTALEASLVGAVLPAIVALVSWAVAGEKLRPLQVTGVGLVVAGVALVAIISSGSQGATLNLLGYALLLGSAVSWAFFTLLGRRVGAEVPSAVVAAFVVAFGALFLLPLALFDLARGGWPALSPLAWAMVVFLGFGGSGLTFVLWNYGLKTLTAGVAGSLTNLVPFVGAFCAWAFLKEQLAWVHLWGGLTVLAGLRLVTWSR
ncbi:MAG: DMT family transporter [Bacillota bacterium]|nr:DMT family transporter [Bacillota bacterium]